MTALPRLMVAPNGARLTKADHPALPVTLEEVVATARACHRAGADGLHLHLRDPDGRHILDAGLYHEALSELSHAVPKMAVQITTEAVGMYSSEHQREIALSSGAKFVSTSVRELASDCDTGTVTRFFEDCASTGIDLQIILYDLSDLALLREAMSERLFRSPDLQILFVLGRYSKTRDSDPTDLQPFLDHMRRDCWAPDWAVCAFGKGETACLEKAYSEDGKIRVGFENSTWAADGTRARDNAQRVAEMSEIMLGQAVD